MRGRAEEGTGWAAWSGLPPGSPKRGRVRRSAPTLAERRPSCARSVLVRPSRSRRGRPPARPRHTRGGCGRPRSARRAGAAPPARTSSSASTGRSDRPPPAPPRPLRSAPARRPPALPQAPEPVPTPVGPPVRSRRGRVPQGPRTGPRRRSHPRRPWTGRRAAHPADLGRDATRRWRRFGARRMKAVGWSLWKSNLPGRLAQRETRGAPRRSSPPRRPVRVAASPGGGCQSGKDRRAWPAAPGPRRRRRWR